MFLDVEMPLEMPLTYSRKLKDRRFETVFVTAYDHYAIEALNNHASYYLLKPISIDELIKAVDHVTQIKEKKTIPKQNTISKEWFCVGKNYHSSARWV